MGGYRYMMYLFILVVSALIGFMLTVVSVDSYVDVYGFIATWMGASVLICAVMIIVLWGMSL